MFAWLTKNNIPSGRIEYVLSLPDDETWRADFLGALFLLTQPQNWELDQGLVPQQMADEWEKVFYDFNEGIFNLIPIGCYFPYAGTSIPGGWLLCDGQAVSRAAYAALFSVIGVTFGNGNGSTTFNVPNLKGKIPVGLDSAQTEFDSLGETGGSKAHTLSTGEIASHNHTQDQHTHVQNAHTHIQDQHTHVQNVHTHIQDQHTHVQNAHDHVVFGSSFAPLTGTGRLLQLTSGTSNAISQGTVATNQNTTPTNQNTTPTNQNTTPTNQNTTPTNQNTTPTNQNTGGGGAHNNLQPYLVSNYIIKY